MLRICDENKCLIEMRVMVRVKGYLRVLYLECLAILCKIVLKLSVLLCYHLLCSKVTGLLRITEAKAHSGHAFIFLLVRP